MMIKVINHAFHLDFGEIVILDIYWILDFELVEGTVMGVSTEIRNLSIQFAINIVHLHYVTSVRYHKYVYFAYLLLLLPSLINYMTLY